jgi:hypothetical protein
VAPHPGVAPNPGVASHPGDAPHPGVGVVVAAVAEVVVASGSRDPAWRRDRTLGVAPHPGDAPPQASRLRPIARQRPGR